MNAVVSTAIIIIPITKHAITNSDFCSGGVVVVGWGRRGPENELK